MLRVFKLTSPMSVGSWILGGERRGDRRSPRAHALLGLVPAARRARRGRPPRCSGLPLATYTGVLLANTAVPVWHEARRELPFVFAAGAATSAGVGGRAHAARRAAPGAAPGARRRGGRAGGDDA